MEVILLDNIGKLGGLGTILIVLLLGLIDTFANVRARLARSN